MFTYLNSPSILGFYNSFRLFYDQTPQFLAESQLCVYFTSNNKSTGNLTWAVSFVLIDGNLYYEYKIFIAPQTIVDTINVNESDPIALYPPYDYANTFKNYSLLRFHSDKTTLEVTVRLNIFFTNAATGSLSYYDSAGLTNMVDEKAW